MLPKQKERAQSSPLPAALKQRGVSAQRGVRTLKAHVVDEIVNLLRVELPR
jgi:hypothetical protein